MMRRQWLRYGLVGLAIGLTVFIVACGGGQANVDEGGARGDAPAGQVLLEERCMQCHGSDRATSASKSEAEWRETVERMVSKGAQVSTAEVDTLVAYLAEMYGP